jgi:PIN domain nuclease of toxin-antitoxin system
VRLLVDTSTLLWWRDGSPRLPARVSDQISHPDNNIVISIISFWEIVIKKTLGKLRFAEDFEAVMTDEEFDLLTVSYAHLRVLADLPQHHRDPLDRLLIAQALAERIPIITADRAFAPYGVAIVW